MMDSRPMNESYWVEPGRLLAGEHPGHWEPTVMRRRLCGLLDAGIRTFIDLSNRADRMPSYEPMLAKICRDRGIVAACRAAPMVAHNVPQDAADVCHALWLIRQGLDFGGRVYVHCNDGVNRTGMVMGCWLVEQGFDPEAALDELERRFAVMNKARTYHTTPANVLQAEWVENWTPRLGLRLHRSQAC